MFIPIYDINPLDHVRRPYVTWGLIVLNIAIYVLGQHGFSGAASEASLLCCGAIPAVVTGQAVLPEGYPHLPAVLTPVSYMFLHGGWLHLVGNMAFLWVFGDNVEDAFGHVRFVAFYLLCGLAAGAAYILIDTVSEAPLVGASGAISGVIAAYLMLHPNIRLWALVFMKIPLRVPVYWVIAAWLALQVWQAFAATDQETAWWAHIGGFGAGALLTPLMRRRGVRLFDRDPSGVAVRRAEPKSER